MKKREFISIPPYSESRSAYFGTQWIDWLLVEDTTALGSIRTIYKYPEGAIKTREEIERLVAEGATIYVGYGLGKESRVAEVCLEGTYLEDVTVPRPMTFLRGTYPIDMALRSFNIPQDTESDSFLFFKKDDADSYVALCKPRHDQNALLRIRKRHRIYR